MKSILKWGFVVGFIVVSISSCTFEKRVYRSGYRIQKKHSIGKNESFSEKSENHNKSEIDITENTNESVVIETNELFNNTSDSVIRPNTSLASGSTITIENSKSSNTEITSNYISISENETLKTEHEQNLPESNLINNQGIQKSDRGVGYGIVMIVIALLLFGIGLLFNSVLGVFGLILFIIFAIAAAIYFLIGLFVLISAI